MAWLAEVVILTWNYRARSPATRHTGPMAQDIRAAFGLGKDDKHIGALDANGVALAAIQALYKLSLEKDRRIAEFEQRLDELQRQFEERK